MDIKQPYELNFAEFSASVTVIHVVSGKGKTGLAKTGKERLLVDNDEDTLALNKLIEELGRSYDDLADESYPPKKEWLDKVVGRLLDKVFHSDLFYGLIPNGRAIVMIKNPRRLTDEACLRTIHRSEIEEAINTGKFVADEILSEYPDVAQPVENESPNFGPSP